MGWSFRRPLNLGPLRVNLSKKGAGFSLGARGLRVGRDASGRNYSQLSIPGTGIYRRDYYGNSSHQTLPSNSPQRTQHNQQASPNSKYLFLLVGIAAVAWVLIRLIVK
jgi:hypothetical protein